LGMASDSVAVAVAPDGADGDGLDKGNGGETTPSDALIDQCQTTKEEERNSEGVRSEAQAESKRGVEVYTGGG
jgi:hypothetical protein